MNAPEPTTDSEPTDPLPTGVDSPESKHVPLSLRIAGRATIDRIANALGMRKITLYPLLRALSGAGLVGRSGSTYVRLPHERAGGRA